MIAHQAHQDRVDAGIGYDWERLPTAVSLLRDVLPCSQEIQFRRVGNSCRGIGEMHHLKWLRAISVNQPFLDEICHLSNIENLMICGVTATDLTGLKLLPRLRRLVVQDATKITDLNWASPLRTLESLAIENAKRVTSVEPLGNLRNLKALGVEGSMWTAMRVESLGPISFLNQLEWLFLTNLRVIDKTLQPIHKLSKLKVLYCARFFPRAEFEKLQQSLPHLRCQWFGDGYDL